jgi:hypothetical protein
MSGSQQAGGGTSISFQNVHGVQFNTAGGDMVVSTGAVTANWDVAREHLSELRANVGAMALPAPTRAVLDRTLDEADREARSPAPDKTRLARHLESAAEILRSSGALVTAGAQVVAPLHALAAWLGPLGASAARLLTP